MLISHAHQLLLLLGSRKRPLSNPVVIMDVFPSTFSFFNVFLFILACIFTAAAIFAHQVGIFDLLLLPVDRKSKKHGGNLVAETLKAHGVKFIFTLVGGHVSPVLVGCEKLGIRVIDTRHEVTTVFAADAVARLSGGVGVACVTAGPGVTNTITAVKNAQMAESPILILGGAAATIQKGRGALQDIDQLVLFKPLCKYVATVTRVRDIIPVLRKAIQVAQSDTPGPVFVELPIDTLYPLHILEKEIVPKRPPKTLMQKITAFYLRAHVTRLFAGAWDPQDNTPLPVSRPFATRSEVAKVAGLIKNAKKPLILVGSQVVLPPVEAEQTKLNLEKLGIPCYLGGMARGLLGRNSDIHIRQRRRDALKEADVVILAGAICDFRLQYGQALSTKSKIVVVNRSSKNLYLNARTFWKPTIALEADPGFFIQQLSKALGGYSCDPTWPRELKSRDEEKETANSLKADEDISSGDSRKLLNPLKVLEIAEEVMSNDSIIIADGGDFVGSAAYILRPRGPLTWLDPGPFGTLGVGGGFALGAKLCRPESEVWIVYGDGSLGFSVAEFDTLSRHKLPVIALVGNDACWTQIAREQVPMFQSSVACMLSYSKYEEVARGYGGVGYCVDGEGEGGDEERIRGTLEEAKERASSGESPVLVNCLIGKTNFRDGSISV